jgi:hypothetical protein
MTRTLRTRAFLILVTGFCLASTTLLSAAERSKKLLKVGEYNAENESVELFEGIKAGTLAVKMIPKDSTQAVIQITNKSPTPLNIRLPEAFAGVHVLAQVGGRAGAGGMGMQGGMAQGMGGGMGGMGGGGMGGMGGGGGGGMFNVPAEKVGEFKVTCACLEHGKPEPRSTMTYEVRPIESFSDKPGVAEVCQLLGRGMASQRVAQAALWHLNSGLSWDELLAKRIERADGSSYPYFEPVEMQQAYALASHALKVAEDKKPTETPTAPLRSAADSLKKPGSN